MDPSPRGEWIRYVVVERLRTALQGLRAEIDALIETREAYIPFHNANRLGIALGKVRTELEASTVETGEQDDLSTVRNTIRCRDAYVSDEMVLVNIAETLNVTLPSRTPAPKAKAVNPTHQHHPECLLLKGRDCTCSPILLSKSRP